MIARSFAALMLSLATIGAASAQSAFPNRSINLVVTYPPGGTTDVLGRLQAQGLTDQLKQPVTVLNRDGGGGSIGAASVAQAQPDGYTIGFTAASALALQPQLTPSIPYKFSSFDPVCQTYDLIFALAVPQESPFKTLAELVAAAKQEPGKLSYGVNGRGTGAHIAILELIQHTGIEMLHVPYRGDASVVVPLKTGQVSVGVIAATLASAQEMRILGIFSANRRADLPDTPTMLEQGYPVVQSAIGGLVAPAGLPEPVLTTLRDACRKMMTSDSYKQAVARIREPAAYADGPAFKEIVEKDIASKIKVLQKAGITP